MSWNPNKLPHVTSYRAAFKALQTSSTIFTCNIKVMPDYPGREGTRTDRQTHVFLHWWQGYGCPRRSPSRRAARWASECRGWRACRCAESADPPSPSPRCAAPQTHCGGHESGRIQETSVLISDKACKWLAPRALKCIITKNHLKLVIGRFWILKKM